VVAEHEAPFLGSVGVEIDVEEQFTEGMLLEDCLASCENGGLLIGLWV